MKKFVRVLKWILIFILIIAAGWLAFFFRVNIGVWIRRFLGTFRPDNPPRTVVGPEGEVIGEEVEIVRSSNPLRDKGELTLSNGDTVTLPDGVVDSDVIGVVKVEGTEVYDIQIKHTNLTDVFD